jgi:hypothetical protein
MKVERWNPEKDGVLNEATLRRKLESVGYRTNCYVYPPGTFFAMHTHSVEKMDAVLSGQFRIITHEGIGHSWSGRCRGCTLRRRTQR